VKIVQLEAPLLYDGTQLSTAFVDRHAPGETDAAVLFTGGADVDVEHLVDLEDAEAGAVIWSPRMAHAVIEHRDVELAEGTWRLRLLVHLAADWIAARSGTQGAVRGDDSFVGHGKLSFAVATRSPRGCLMHVGVNIETEGTPVPTSGLADLRIPSREFLGAMARLYADELVSVAHAAAKVRPVT
jgi:hypothetical protein